MKAWTLWALIFLGAWCDDWRTSDQVEVLQELASPDGQHVATVFECSGGGAAGYVYRNVNLRRATEEFSQRDFLLGEQGWFSFDDLSVRWLADDHLELSYRWSTDDPAHREANAGRVAEKDGVRVSYRLLGEE